MMQQMQNEGGTNPGDMKNMLKMMEESQKDVVNRMLNEETLKRQDQILEKLLDYEKAEKERETEKKRQAEQAKDDHKRNLSQFMEYNLKKDKETELLKTVPPSFNKFYKNKVSAYFNNLANE
jgi:DNA topoisomerase VI subunit B